MKGQLETTTTTKLILAVAVTVLLLAFQQGLSRGLREDAPIQACKLSVASAAAGKSIFRGAIDFGTSCPRGDALVFEDETPTAISTTIARELYLCADRFNHGKLDFAGLNWIFADKLFSENQFTCLICKTFNFENPNLIAEYTKNPTQFTDDLAHTILPQQKISYKQFFDNANKGVIEGKSQLSYRIASFDDTIKSFNPKEPNVIYFATQPQKGFFPKLVTDLFGSTPPPKNAVYLTTAKDMKTICGGNLLN